MIVEIMDTDEHFGLKKGYIYEAERYLIDPDKITLIRRLRKKDLKPFGGKSPICNVYSIDVKLVNFYDDKYKRLLKIYLDLNDR